MLNLDASSRNTQENTPGLIVLTTVVVSQLLLAPEDAGEHDEVVRVVMSAGTVVTLSDAEVDTLSVVTVAN